MAGITVRNPGDDAKIELRKRAAGHGRAMEVEVRTILPEAVGREFIPEKGLGAAIQELCKPLAGIELKLPPRGPMRVPLGIDWDDHDAVRP